MDARALTNRRPTGQVGQQIVSGYVSLNQPAPSAFTDSLFVVIPSLNSERSKEFAGMTWPRSQGDALPTAGTEVTLGYNERRQWRVLAWGGQYQS